MNAQQLLLHSVSRNALPNPEPLPLHQLTLEVPLPQVLLPSSHHSYHCQTPLSQTRNFIHTPPPLAQHPTFPITPRRSTPSHHRRPLHRPPVSNTQHVLSPPPRLCPGARWPVVERHGWGIRRERRARARARAQTQTSGGRRRFLSRR